MPISWPPPSDVLIAQRFSVEKIAGRGAMGTVFQALDHFTGQHVALKLIHPDSQSGQDIERFLREARFLGELHHPNIVSYVAHGTTSDGVPYLAMEWLNGEDLATRLRRGPLSLDDALLLLRSVAAGLAAAHSRSIVHRDLKPTNLFLPSGPDPQPLTNVRILDFGSARRVRTDPRATQIGAVVGTPQYMAPEQARGERGILPAADIFALGCVLYECLTGVPAFVADSVPGALVRILFQDPVSPRGFRPDLPPALDSLLARMMAKDVGSRPAHAGVLLAELSAQALSGGPALPPPRGELVPPQTAIRDGEQAIYSVLVAHEPPGEVSVPLSLPPPSSESAPRAMSTLRDALESMGLQVDTLLTDTLIALLRCDDAGAPDQTVLIARAALLVKERWPELHVGVATGRGARCQQAQQLVGDVTTAALGLLPRAVDPAVAAEVRGAFTPRPASGSDPATTAPAAGGRVGVWVDALSARLMARQFVIEGVPGRALLLAERPQVDAQYTLLGMPTPCVGRELELGSLEHQLRSCIDDRSAVGVLYCGPAGIGKSRLCHEFLRRLSERAWPLTTLVSQGELLDSGGPYTVITGALRQLAGVRSSDGLQVQRARLGGRLAQHLSPQAAPRILSHLGELLGLSLIGPDGRSNPYFPVPSQSPDGMDEPATSARAEVPQSHEQVGAALIDWLRAECASRPVLWLIDDLQWAHARSIELLGDVLRALANEPFMLAVFARDDLLASHPRLWAHRPLQRHTLKALSRRASESLVRHAIERTPDSLAAGRIDAAAIDRIVAQAGGNALYLEELTRAALLGDDSAAPATVIAMMQARITRLPVRTRHVLHAASVFGPQFWRGGVAQLLGYEAHDAALLRALGELHEQELIVEQADSELGGDVQYAFRHVLVRDATYALLTDGARVSAHSAAARFLLGAHRDAARGQLVSALDALDALPDDAINRRRRIDLLLRLMDTSRSSDEPVLQQHRLRQAEVAVRQLMQDAPTADLPRQQVMLNYWLGNSYYLSNQPTAALAHFREVLKQDVTDVRMLSLPLGAMGRIGCALGRYDDAASLFTRALELAGPVSQAPEQLVAQALLGMAQTARGQCAAGLALTLQAIQLADQIGSPVLIAPTRGPLGMAYLIRGEYDLCLRALQAGFAPARQLGARVFAYLMHVIQAWALARAGQPQQAVEPIQAAYDIQAQLANQLVARDWLSVVECECAFARGDWAACIEHAQQTLQVAREHGALLGPGVAHRKWAEALLARGDGASEEIAAHLDESERILRAGNAAVERVRTERVRVRWLQRQGQQQAAETLHIAVCEQFERFGLPHEVPTRLRPS